MGLLASLLSLLSSPLIVFFFFIKEKRKTIQFKEEREKSKWPTTHTLWLFSLPLGPPCASAPKEEKAAKLRQTKKDMRTVIVFDWLVMNWLINWLISEKKSESGMEVAAGDKNYNPPPRNTKRKLFSFWWSGPQQTTNHSTHSSSQKSGWNDLSFCWIDEQE